MEVKCPRCGKSDTVQSSPSGGYECSLCKSGFGRCENFDKTIIRSITYDAYPAMLTVAAVYLVMVIGLTAVLGRLERRMRKSDKR